MRGAADARCDGARADGPVADGRRVAVPVRRDLHAERRLPGNVAPGHGGRGLRVQAGDAAARAVPRSAGHGQQAEGAVGRVGPPGRQLGVPERHRARSARATTRATRSARSSRRRPSISASPTRWRATRRCGRSRSAPRTWARPAGACDGFPCTFFNTLSWRDDTSPLPVGINPRVTFERMFGETGTTEQRKAALKEKQSMLDSVTEETAKLRGTLGRVRQRHPRRVPEQHPPGRAAARSHGEPARAR